MQIKIQHLIKCNKLCYKNIKIYPENAEIYAKFLVIV
jgi:hypothetical protein